MIVFGAVLTGTAQIQAVVVENGNRGLAAAVRDVNGIVIPFGLAAGSDINVPGHNNYKENEIIVKFKKPVSDILGQQLAGKSSLKNLRLTKSISNLNSKHRVKSIEPVFKDFNAGREKMKNLLKKSPQELSRDEKRILRRQQRAPKNAKVPELDRIYKVKVEEGQSAEQAVADYRNDPAVEYAELNYKISVCLTPNDSDYPKQWSLNNTGQMYPESRNYRHPPGTPGCDVNAIKAWNLSTGSSEIVVAVIDTGVDYNHMDLQGNMWTDANGNYGYDFVNDDNSPMDDYGHGTHCAGIIAARTNNSLDIAGISWDTKIMAVKFLDFSGSGWLSDGAEAIKYAVNNGAEVLSNSWEFGTQPEEGPNTIREAIQYAVSNGAIVVAAAGNENISTPSYPAAYENVISVAATDSNDDRASFSNYGSWVDIAAPGVDILSLHAAGTDMYANGKHFYPYSDPNATMYIASGTSMACPHVSGACALLLSINPYLSCDDVNSILRNTSDVLKDQSTCASGRLDIYKAVLNVSSSKGNINMDRFSYSCDADIGIYLRDLDLAGNNSYSVNLTASGGDSEIVTLYAVSPGIGIFTGSTAASFGDPCEYDGKLQVTDGQIITVTYYDTDDGTGNPAEPNDTANADCAYPIISNISFAEKLIGPEQVISFQTSEPTTARIIRGIDCGETNMVYEDLTIQSNHVIRFGGMEPLTKYYFKIEVNDLAGNTTVDSKNGNCYRFVTDAGPRSINVPRDYNTIQKAIDAAWDGSTIWLADGTYIGIGNRDVDFKGKAITIRSINGPNNCIINCQRASRAFIFNNYESATSVLQGLTVMDGNSDVGGAVAILYSSPRIEGCVFRANSAINGGAILCINGNIEINNCTFTDNRGDEYGSGGAIIVSGGQITITHCIFSANTAAGYGGAIFAYAIDQRIDNCTFIGNICTVGGGAIHQTDGFLTATNCAVLNNSTNAFGGGFRFSSYSSGLNISIFNCTFSGNKADFGGGGIYNHNSYLEVSNSILWGNGANGQSDEIYPEEAHFSYCDINGCGGSGAGWNALVGFDDGNNIDKDPLFTDANLHISRNSPCIDAGNPNGNYNGQTDIDGEARDIGQCVDIGADEFNMPEPNGHWWKFDETSGTTAYDSVGTNNGTFNGNNSRWVTGHIGGAVDFNGVSDYFSVSGLDGAYNDCDRFTVAGWFKTSQSTGIQTIVGNWSQHKISQTQAAYSGWQVCVENKKVAAKFAHTTPGSFILTGTSDVNDGQWHHFALVHPIYQPPNSRSAVLYVDGQQEATLRICFWINSNTKFRIGDGSYVVPGKKPGPVTLKGGPFNGAIDDVMIFNRALTADEIGQLYEVGR